jgi:hypothetical protein
MPAEDETRSTLPETGNTPSDLRTMIADTLRDAKEADAAAPAAPAAGGLFEDRTAVGSTAAGSGEPPKPGEGEDKDKDKGGESGAPPAPGPTEPAEREPAGPAAAPQHWAAEDKATFEGLPTAAKGPFLNLYKRMERGFQPRLERLATLEKDLPAMQERVQTYDRDYSEIDRAFGPHREKLRSQGRGPKEILQIWYNTEAGLANPEQRDAVIANIIAAYQCDPFKIAEHLNARRGFAPQSPGGDGGGQPQPQVRSQIDPALEARFSALENAERNRVETIVRDNMDNAKRIYEDFANAKGADGALLHPDLVALEPVMTAFADVDRKAGKQIDLQDLYTRAEWATPSTRDRLLERQGADEQRKAADERKAKAEAARRASSSVTGSPGPGAAPQDLGAPDRSIRDEIRAQMNGGRRS